jgi:hypothetical protein
MTAADPLDVVPILARANNATSDRMPEHVWKADDSGGLYLGGYAAVARNMAEFMASAKADVPLLVAEVLMLRDRIERAVAQARGEIIPGEPREFDGFGEGLNFGASDQAETTLRILTGVTE